MQLVAAGQASPNSEFSCSESILVGTGAPGEAGLNVTSCPLWSTAVHCVGDGQATLNGPPEWSIFADRGAPADVGLNVTSLPSPSTTVHCVVDGQAIASNPSSAPGSTETGVGVPGEVGLNVTSKPLPSTAVHWLLDGHAIALRLASEPEVPGSTVTAAGDSDE